MPRQFLQCVFSLDNFYFNVRKAIPPLSRGTTSPNSRILSIYLLDSSSLSNRNTHNVTPADSRITSLSTFWLSSHICSRRWKWVHSLLKANQQYRTIFKVCMHSEGLSSLLAIDPKGNKPAEHSHRVLRTNSLATQTPNFRSAL